MISLRLLRSCAAIVFAHCFVCASAPDASAAGYPTRNYESWPSERKAEWARHGCDVDPEENRKANHDDIWCFMTSFALISGFEDADEPLDDLIPPDNVANRGIVESVRQKVLKCWSPPPLRLEDFKQLHEIKLILRLRKDGTVEDVKLSPLTAKRAASNSIMNEFSAAAIEVVNACQPYGLPVESYDFWQEISPLRIKRSDFTVQEK